MKWAAESFQAVLFFSGTLPGDVLDIWKQIIEVSPTSFQSNAPNNLPGGRASLFKGSSRLDLSIQPGRIDLLLSPHAATPGHYPVLEEPTQTLRDFAGVAQKLLSDFDGNRVALVAGLVKRASGPGEALVALFREATGIEVKDDALDLAFTFNYRAKTAGGLPRNRVEKFEAAERQIIEVQAGGIETRQRVVAAEYGLWRQIDLNTLAGPSHIDRKVAREVFDGFVSEIAEELK